MWETSKMFGQIISQTIQWDFYYMHGEKWWTRMRHALIDLEILSKGLERDNDGIVPYTPLSILKYGSHFNPI